jgi:hypothetical protein
MRRLRTLVPAMLVVALAFALVKLVIFGSAVPVEAAVR